MRMADPNPRLETYRPRMNGGGFGCYEVSEPPRCDARNWRGEPCILAIHEGPHVFLKPPPRLLDTLWYWWLWLWDELHEAYYELKRWRLPRC